ncbi:MAG: integrase, partial [Sphingorhabdus sp.]
MALDLSKVGNRERLKVQREPHWQRLRAGCFLGFRPSKRGGKGTWIARIYDDDASRYHVKSLGDFGTLLGNEMFAAAKRETEKLAELLETGGVLRAKVETVADACRDYASDRPEAEQRFQRYVYDDAIAKVRLDKLRRRHVKEWRERLEVQPVLVSRRNSEDPVKRARAHSTVNRDMAALRAALAKVLSHGAPSSEAAWQEA